MADLNGSNCSVDKNSGAVLFKPSPELLEIKKLRQEIKTLDNKMDEILTLLRQGGGDNG